MPLDSKLATHIFDGSAPPTTPANLTLHTHTSCEAVEWRDGLIVVYDPNTGGRRDTEGRRVGMLPWSEMLTSLQKTRREFWGANMLDFVQSSDERRCALALSSGQRLLFIGTVYMQTGYSVGRQKYNARSRRVFRALERDADGTYREVIVPRSGYWLRGRDLIASR